MLLAPGLRYGIAPRILPVAATHRPQVAVDRTSPKGRVIGIDVIPAQPPRGVSTIQGNFLSKSVQDEVKRFIRDSNVVARPSEVFSDNEEEEEDQAASAVIAESGHGYLDSQAKTISTIAILDETLDGEESPTNAKDQDRVVDVVLSDMSAPWDQTDGFWKRSISDPYFRMMNTSGINFRDHAGSMVTIHLSIQNNQH